jgi:hypothetical protein
MPRFALPLLLVLVPLTSGCVAVAAAGLVGMGVFQYARNEVAQDYPSDLEDTWKAALAGLEKLEIEPELTELTATEGRIEHADMRVLVERHPEGFTRVRVRVGAFHSSDRSRRAQLVLEEISAALERHDGLKAWAEKALEG